MARQNEFSLRFYGQTDEAVETCIAELKRANPKIVSHYKESEVIGMNVGLRPSHNICLVLKDAESTKAMLWNSVCQKIYMEYANATEHVGELSLRRTGDIAWKHPKRT